MRISYSHHVKLINQTQLQSDLWDLISRPMGCTKCWLTNKEEQGVHTRASQVRLMLNDLDLAPSLTPWSSLIRFVKWLVFLFVGKVGKNNNNILIRCIVK